MPHIEDIIRAIILSIVSYIAVMIRQYIKDLKDTKDSLSKHIVTSDSERLIIRRNLESLERDTNMRHNENRHLLEHIEQQQIEQNEKLQLLLGRQIERDRGDREK